MSKKQKTNKNVDPESVKQVFRELNKLLARLKEMQPKCAICLDNVETRCYLNECLHSYCLRCATEWSRTKKNCPACGQKFVAVFYNVRSVRTYHRVDFGKRVENTSCLLRSMHNIRSYFEVKETLRRILLKHNISFETFHRKVVFLTNN